MALAWVGLLRKVVTGREIFHHRRVCHSVCVKRDCSARVWYERGVVFVWFGAWVGIRDNIQANIGLSSGIALRKPSPLRPHLCPKPIPRISATESRHCCFPVRRPRLLLVGRGMSGLGDCNCGGWCWMAI